MTRLNSTSGVETETVISILQGGRKGIATIYSPLHRARWQGFMVSEKVSTHLSSGLRMQERTVLLGSCRKFKRFSLICLSSNRVFQYPITFPILTPSSFLPVKDGQGSILSSRNRNCRNLKTVIPGLLILRFLQFEF